MFYAFNLTSVSKYKRNYYATEPQFAFQITFIFHFVVSSVET